jgi:hypothetical protein
MQAAKTHTVSVCFIEERLFRPVGAPIVQIPQPPQDDL